MEHLKRIQKAVDFIEERLKEELPADQIAKVAGFSSWHFQRLFRATVGDGLKEYIRKRRLSSALVDLATSDRRMIELAVEYGFESQEAFTRAFKASFGKNPGECRKTGVRAVVAISKPKITLEYLDHLYGGLTMEPKILELNEMKLVGIGSNFISVLSPDKNNHVVIPQLWDRYLKRCKEIDERVSRVDYGLCDRISEETQRTHPDECFYMACAEVASFDSVPEGMETRVVPGGRYAVFTHTGTLDHLEHTMNFIYGSWLPKSGEELRDAPDLERYDERFKPDSEESELDIFIPLK